jgi:hypothetical protein
MAATPLGVFVNFLRACSSVADVRAKCGTLPSGPGDAATRA